MTNESEKLKIFTDMQQSEANLHWSRNSYFLVVSSILLLALSQFNNNKFQIIIGFLGLVLSCSWVLIQHRSSVYIKYWKEEAEKLSSSTKIPSVYPKTLSGIEMRKIAYILPLSFLVLWIAIIIVIIFNI